MYQSTPNAAYQNTPNAAYQNTANTAYQNTANTAYAPTSTSYANAAVNTVYVKKNKVAILLTICAFIIYIAGFIFGIVLGKETGAALSLYSYFSEGGGSSFNTATMLLVWVVSFINGTLFLGISEIVKLLNIIRHK